MDFEEIATAAIDDGMRIHRDLGPGLLESVYEVALSAKLARRGYQVERQVPIDFNYDGVDYQGGFRADIMVERALIMEVKSATQLVDAHAKQLLTYLRLADLRLGLVMNFGGALFKGQFRRVANSYSRSP